MRRTYSLTEGSVDPRNQRMITGVGTTFMDACRLRRSVRDNVPNSAQMKTEAINVFVRDD